MLLREALRIATSAKRSHDREIALLCSFEPLHLKTYLQAVLAQAFPEDTPTVVTYGFDQLLSGLEDTATRLKAAPALICLSWEDINPRLSWRSRGKLEAPARDELDITAGRLVERLERWLNARQGAETCVALPPLESFPLLDAVPAFALGGTAVAAQAWLWRIADMLERRKAKLLRIEPADFNYRDFLLAGFPFSIEQCEILVRRFVGACCRLPDRKKVLVVDLDGTLWHGVIGEDGPSNLECATEGLGFTFHNFQRFMGKLKAEGTLLAFCSKNSPETVLPIFDTLGMPLSLSDFAAYRCNWENKSDNLKAIARELNLGLDSMVIVDDNDAELAEILAHAPGVTRLRTPHAGAEWQSFFRHVQELFGAWRVSAEDRIRTGSFIQERQRQAVTLGNESADHGLSHLKELSLEISINVDAFEDPRSFELINKTNQFNLTGARISREQWLSWSTAPGAACLSARLKDRYGDFGVICILVGVRQGDGLEVHQFVLSCRAFGRGVEDIVLGNLIQQASCDWITGSFLDSGKNEPARLFLAKYAAAPMTNGRWRFSRLTIQEAAARVLAETGATVLRSPEQQKQGGRLHGA